MSVNTSNQHSLILCKRFRGFLPVVVDIETAGFNYERDAILEIAIVMLTMEESGILLPTKTHAYHIKPFEGANLDREALEFTGIDPYHPFRFAVEEREALLEICSIIETALKETNCSKAVLVGHNPMFDLNFLKAAIKRTKIKGPFHKFTTFDTATLGGLAFGQTVLARACKAAQITFNVKEAHSAIYDAERTAELFCKIVNQWSNAIKEIDSSSLHQNHE
ncbi:MAG: ribonuclease T [Gammaproteobacteria bacterium RIFCSPHIGHO2_12_FULL_35_23]|nr:MAG: ribonuclease T [Gammaproteobacteria bacterium RIFCSPHIGHO2_12_FULL_35_23]